MSEDFSTRLAIAIARSGKFKGDLASHCGVALSTVSRWLKGARPKPATIAQIAQFLGVDPLWLVGEADDQKTAKLAFDSAIYAAGIAMRKDAHDSEEARLRKTLAMETTGEFMERMADFTGTARSFMEKCRALCRAIEQTPPDGPLPAHVRLRASELSDIWPQMLGAFHDVLSETAILRLLAESSPELTKILRTE